MKMLRNARFLLASLPRCPERWPPSSPPLPPQQPLRVGGDGGSSDALGFVDDIVSGSSSSPSLSKALRLRCCVPRSPLSYGPVGFGGAGRVAAGNAPPPPSRLSKTLLSVLLRYDGKSDKARTAITRHGTHDAPRTAGLGGDVFFSSLVYLRQCRRLSDTHAGSMKY